jgi:hypothetical protein
MAAFRVVDDEKKYKLPPTISGVLAEWPVVYGRNNGEAGTTLCPS